MVKTPTLKEPKTLRLKTKVVFSMLSVIVIGILIAEFFFISNFREAYSFQTVNIGMTEEEVLQSIGKPDFVDPGKGRYKKFWAYQEIQGLYTIAFFNSGRVAFKHFQGFSTEHLTPVDTLRLGVNKLSEP